MFETERAAILSVLTQADRVVEKRNTIPILGNVAIVSDDDGLCLHASDLDIELQARFAANVQPGFKPFTAPSIVLLNIVKKLPAGATITCQQNGDQDITLKSGRSRFQLQTLPESDFPYLKPQSYPWRIAISAGALAGAIAAVSFAISTEETRYYLNGIFMHPTEGGLFFVATDGHRLARRFVQLAEPIPGMQGVIIPRKTVHVLEKLLDGLDCEIDVDVSAEAIRFHLPTMTLTSKLINGNFPDYHRIIPISNTLKATMEIATLKETVDRLGAIIEGKTRTIRFDFCAGGSLRLVASNADAGSGEEEIPYAGDIEIETGYNGKYVLDAVTTLPAKGNVVFNLANAGTAALVRAEGENPDNLILLMPMRV